MSEHYEEKVKDLLEKSLYHFTVAFLLFKNFLFKCKG